ncbi:tachykinins [Condylostylus longicornis]|uniref:tachykinins n=1 Tax=Condylostylus longicornis TaxID=2530218 RepID=UPI00244DE8C6|nr:tachykinins [Condylostylus longicornis]XP_055379174.1 tachykinins [Condylostylus longicornis]XP_055379175.1 tachykinins [Condylostylus longicornis]XP_055379176.1 tachykinins [Condylostylus longicornis]
MANNILFVLSVCAVTFVIDEIAATRNIGFIGTKGKRDSKEDETESAASSVLKATISPLSAEATNLIENETNGISSGNNELYLSNLPDRSLFKRTPSGFIGSRGKKEYEYPESNNGNLNFEEFDPTYLEHNAAWFNSLQQNSKRTPTGFVGMRGKKKPASGFYGVRGKKDSSLDELYQQLENIFEDSPDYNDQLYSATEYFDNEKRSNRNGFVGVRGRRYPYGLVPHLEELDKRVPNGFVGMRGRRFDINEFENDIYDQAEKRKNNNAFFGVRGKKDVSKQLSQMNEIDKRSPLASYFGVRGEKRLFNSNGFFGTRGKKQPYEFRGKFVGVRGKKSFINNSGMDLSLNDNLIDSDIEKRTPNGFVAMRG